MLTGQSPVPSFTRISAISPPTNPAALLTAGNEQLVLYGANFGPPATSVLTYTGPSPLRPGFLITYSPRVISQNDSAVVFVTTPGIGGNLQFTLRKFDNVTGTSSGLASYAIPRILNITVPTGTTAYTTQSLRPTGGDTVIVNVANLGPLTYPGQPTVFTHWLRFGGTAGTFGYFYGCTRQAATADRQITCRVPVGGGTNHTVRVQSGFTGQWSVTGNPNALISYVTPVVTSTSPTIGFMSTAGLEQIVIRGLNMPFPSWVINGLCPVSASFGFAPAVLPPTPSQTLTPLSYRMTSCTGAFDTDGRTPVITCQTPPGTGRGYILLTRVGGIFTNYLLNRTIAYSPPSLYDFSGPGAINADTLGNQTVVINGKNFGTNASLIQAAYTLTLKKPTNETGANVTYLSPRCNVTVAHVQLACQTAPGVGADLAWSLVVDGQENINPLTSYAPPEIFAYEIRNTTTGALKAKASTAGGDALWILGKGFGISTKPLLQSLSLTSATGLILPIANATVLSDNKLLAILPPGGGSGWQATVTIADLISEPTTANFSYADPVVQSLSPASGPTSGGSKVVIYATDLTLTIPGLTTVVVFGNPSDASLLPTYLPTSIVPRADTDNSTTLPYIPNAVSFTVPPGAGAGRLVRLLTYLTNEGAPLSPPDPILPASTPLFTYIDPQISSVVLAQPQTPEQLQTATNCFGAEAVALSQVRMISVYGSNFGQGTYPFQSFGLELYNASAWTNSTGYYCSDPLEWRDSSIVAYTLLSSGTLRVHLVTLDPVGTPITQVSNSFSYNDLSPYLTTNTTGPFPTVGGSLIPLQAMYLASAAAFNLTVLTGSTQCIVLDPQNGNPLTTPQEIYTRILTNPNAYSPPGLITANTVWSFSCRLTAGYGSSVPLVMTRLPDGATSNPIGLSFLPPTISLVNGQPPNPLQRLISSTPGDSVQILGANFGSCPTLDVGPGLYTIRSCVDQPGSVSVAQDSLTVVLPPGEGDGVQLQPPFGWQIVVSAGDQSAAPLLFAWAAPEVLAVNAPAFPTAGGTLLTLQGRNFGQSVPLYPQALLPSNLQIAVAINSTAYQTSCGSPQRLGHTLLTCILPEGGGRPSLILSVAGQKSTPLGISYDSPTLTRLLPSDNLTLAFEGANFGVPAITPISCVFLSNRRATGVPQCNGFEDYAGEGELLPSQILFWNHSQIRVALPIGSGSPYIDMIAHGLSIPALSPVLNYTYPPPTLAGISDASGPADGGYPITLVGAGFGGLTVPGSAYPIPLPLTSQQKLWTPVRVLMNDVEAPIVSVSDTALTFTMLPGIGVNYSFQILIDEVDYAIASSAQNLWSYDPPVLTGFLPNPVYVGDQLTPQVLLQGQNLGSLRAFATFPNADASVAIYLDDVLQIAPQRILKGGLDAGIEFGLTGLELTAGPKDARVVVASQTGLSTNTSLNALQVFCEKDYFAKRGEFCLACPTGGSCSGGLSYPVAKAGFFNLNSTYAAADACPASALVLNRDGTTRDVCLVACAPAEACIGANQCAEAYRSTAPAYRCNTCAPKFYKRASECIKCPDAPIMLVVGFLLLAAGLAFIGYLLNRYKVNVAFVSIAIDYFQVISIFLNSKIQWPPVIKNLMYVLSAFNLNLDIVAPECLVPDISYAQKFYFIEGLPLALFGVLLVINLTYIAYKALILKRSRKDLLHHIPALKSAAILIMYFLYLYITRTLLDVFNCAPTVPPSYDANGNLIKYLSVQFEECGKPGGLQVSLIPASVLGLLGYTVGFPAILTWILYKWREVIMLDQLLRAGGQGENRIENPIGYEIRKAYGRMYYQYKPDFFYWCLCILLRKFFIALTTVMFTTNPSFQMAACLLILFLAYAAQVRFNPFMSYSEYADVIKSHLDAAAWSPIHARLKATLNEVQLQGTRKYHRNIMSVTGTIDKVALFQAMGSWLFNYNTVEATMLFCGVLISLMGIMYQSNLIVAGFDTSGRDAITGILLTVIILSILYLASVFGVEIYIACKANQKVTGVLARKGPSLEKSMRSLHIIESANQGVTEVNPILLKRSLKGKLNITEFTEPPPRELWLLFRELFLSQEKMVKELGEQVTALKKGGLSEEGVELVRYVRKREMSPMPSTGPTGPLPPKLNAGAFV